MVNNGIIKRSKHYFWKVVHNKLTISGELMEIAIAVIIVFQAYWLKKSYREEEQALRVQTCFIFRETIFELQGAKMKLEPGTHIRRPSGKNLTGMLNILRVTAQDTLRRRVEERRVFYKLQKPPG